MTLNIEEFLNYLPKKKTFVLFGKDLSYSISDKIHKLIFKYHNLDCDYIFVELNVDELSKALLHLKKYFHGANITIPFKTDVIKYLDFTSKPAIALQSVNTIKVENNQLYGYNTDILGVENTFDVDKVNFKNKKVAILGSGATSNVVAEVIASKNCDFTVFSRNFNTASQLSDNILQNYSVNIDIKLLSDFTDTYDIICNTTPVGMNNLEGISPVSKINNADYIFDVIYNPYYTKLLEDAKLSNIPVRNGLRMLLVQAYYAEQIWNDIELEYVDDISSRLQILLTKKRLQDKNIVLLGFMGCGKSHNAKILSKTLDFDLIDTDKIIESNENKKITDIFSELGEQYFINLEHSLCDSLSLEKNKVISLGGGFVINNPNITKLKENSIFVFIDTDFETVSKRINKDSSRPLTNNRDIKKIFEDRYETYKNLADIHIDNLSNDKEICNFILQNI